MSAPSTTEANISDEVIADLRAIESNPMHAVNCGHALLSLNLARWRQTRDIGWFLTDKGISALAAAKDIQ